MNPDLQRERSNATFSVDAMTHMLDGGKERTERRRKLEAIISRDPTGIFSTVENANLTRNQRYVRALAKHVRLIELCRKLNIADENGEIVAHVDFPVLLAALADDLPTALHWIMFVPNVRSLCDEQQQAAWLKECRDWKMIGCYAQTELGHGSNVRALETTATFQSEAQGGLPGGSFVIHSPTLTSAKFWPGTLGKTANHAMVIARLIDGEGIDRGVHNFLVPLRSMKDHTLLPGVETGDIGAKIGYNTMDNGFCRFTNVIIPRRNMAMRFATVDENGKYVKKNQSEAASKVAYITMMQVRALIVNEAGKNLGKAVTVATRYSVVRKQGFASDSADSTTAEVSILHYTTQQYRLLSLLAVSYCFFFTGKKLTTQFKDVEERLTRSTGNKPVTKQVVADLHASSSALKSFTTMTAADGIEDCRKACGGHGFLVSSGLPELMTTYLQNPTVEGDNHMLPQQVVKVLLKLVQACYEGNKDAIAAYADCDSYDLIPSLQKVLAGEREKCSATSAEELLNLEQVLLPAFRHRAARLLAQVALKLQTSKKESPAEAWNDSLLLMARASHSYAQFLLLRNFVQGIATEAPGPAEAAVLQTLAQLLAHYWMEREMGEFLEDGYLNSKQASWIRANVLKLLEQVRPNAVALVDAFDFSDFRLKSVLGRYDGNVYPAIMDEARHRNPMNEGQDPGPGYQLHLKKLIVDGVGAYTPSRL